MKRVYYLKNCKACQRVLHEIKPGPEVELIDLKENPIEETVLDWLKEKVGSYEALFSKKAILYRKMNLSKMNLSDDDYKKYLLSHYTFIKRPYIIYDDKISMGTTKDSILKAKKIFNIEL